MSLYRIWYSDGNDRGELGRVTAQDIDQAIEYAKKEYLKPDTEIHSEDGDPNFSIYLMLDSCKDCDKDEMRQLNDLEDNEDLCENCERSEYLEIQLDNDADPEYKTIHGTNEYADLNTDIRPTKHNPTLAQAWRDSPQKGVAQLILQTAQTIPAFSKELIEKSLDTLRENEI